MVSCKSIILIGSKDKIRTTVNPTMQKIRKKIIHTNAIL